MSVSYVDTFNVASDWFARESMRQRECVGNEVQNCTESVVSFFGNRFSTPMCHAPPGAVDGSRIRCCILSSSTVTYRTANDGSRSKTLQYPVMSPVSPASRPSAVLNGRCGQSSIRSQGADDVWNLTVCHVFVCSCVAARRKFRSLHASACTHALASDMNLTGCCATLSADETVTCVKYESPVKCSNRARLRFAFGVRAAYKVRLSAYIDSHCRGHVHRVDSCVAGMLRARKRRCCVRHASRACEATCSPSGLYTDAPPRHT
jgi:hypothetical protein